MNRRWRWLVRYILGPYQVKEGKEDEVKEFFEKTFALVSEPDRKALRSFYLDSAKRTNNMAQGLLRGRRAIKTALDWPGDLTKEELKEFCIGITE